MGHFYPRQTILVPVGLITEPNEYGQYPPGALKVARNVTLRAPGKLVQAPSVRNSVQVGAMNAVIHKLAPMDSGVVYSFVTDGALWDIFADGVLQTVPPLVPVAFSQTGRISWAECNRRLVVNATTGTLVRDPVPISTDFRPPGLPQLSLNGSAALSSTSDGWLDADQMVQYRLCLVRRYAGEGGDYTLRSPPSVPYRVFYPPPSTGKKNVLMGITLPPTANSGIEPGDIIELYRTDILATTSQYADAGATYKLVQEAVVTATDIAAGIKPLQDLQPPIVGTLKTAGRELYTNPGIEGETYANLQPPVCQCIASFKGFCFYGNTTERAMLQFGIPGGWGPIANAASGGVSPTIARQKGIGLRTGSGTITFGSPNITGVPAADMVGVVRGQRWPNAAGSPPGFSSANFVIAASGSTITMSDPATASGTSWALEDILEIDGSGYAMHDAAGFFHGPAGRIYEAQFDQAVAPGLYLTGFDAKLMRKTYGFNVGPITVRATNAQNYSPPVAGWDEPLKYIEPLVRKNRVVWSKEQQPEHVPSVSETFVGFGEIYAMNATRDSIFIWCSDGLHRLGGNGGSLGLGAWQVDYSNSTLLLCAPQASAVLDELVYGYTNDGVVEIDSATNVRNLTAGVIGNLLPGRRYREVFGVIVERNETDGEVLLSPGGFDGGASQIIYIYNVREKGWTSMQHSEDPGSDPLRYVTAIAMHRLPPAGAEAHVLFAHYDENTPVYSGWDAPDDFRHSEVKYQPLYGDDPLELKRWMWADYLFDRQTVGDIHATWNFDMIPNIPLEAFDMGVYARAGCPRELGASHSIMPGVSWNASGTQYRFEGLSVAVKQRTNQPKVRGA